MSIRLGELHNHVVRQECAFVMDLFFAISTSMSQKGQVFDIVNFVLVNVTLAQ